jgi:lipopolysaccharide/colanic/teichoic acid biosynthesis glycosyltransferase
MIPIAIALVLVLGWIAKQAAAGLIGQQLRGSIPDYTRAKALAASRILPAELEWDYLETWLAELAELENKPLSALRFAHGLHPAARAIARCSGMQVASTRPRSAITRGVDIAFSVIALIALSPLIAAVWLATRLSTTGGPVQRRMYLGRNGRAFAQRRFRTSWQRPDGTRMPTPVGQVLVRFALDQLPLLMCVVRGEMAVVGPRAVPIDESSQDPALNGELQVRPGIASWEALARVGAIELTLDEARRRDEDRCRRQDLTLLWHVTRHVFSRPVLPPA